MNDLSLIEVKKSTNSAIVNQEFSANLFNDFFKFLDVSEKTRSTYQRALRQLFKFFAEHGINNPSRDDLINFKKSLENAGRKPATIGLYLASARRFFAWTEQRGIYPNVSEGIKAPKQERGHKRDFFGASQLKNILSDIDRSTLEGKRNFAIMTLMITGGLRTIEITRANIEDLRTLGDCTVLYVQGKGRKDRTEFVKISAQVMTAINDYLKARGHVENTAPLFASVSKRNKGGRLTTRTISGVCKNAMIAAGFNSSRLTAHSLRHSAVTLSIMAGASIQEAQAFARHANISTTTIYAHTVDRIKSMCEQSISDAIFN